MRNKNIFQSFGNCLVMVFIYFLIIVAFLRLVKWIWGWI